MRHYLCTGITFINESDKELRLTFFFDLVFRIILGKPHFIAWHVTLCWETDAQIDHNCDCVGTDSYLGNCSVFQKKNRNKRKQRHEKIKIQPHLLPGLRYLIPDWLLFQATFTRLLNFMNKTAYYHFRL
jgi:hypothetical protein